MTVQLKVVKTKTVTADSGSGAKAPGQQRPPVPKGVKIAGGAAILAGAVLLSLSVLVASPFSDAKEKISKRVYKQLELNAAALSENGLQAGSVRLRDWAAIDGDAAIVNGKHSGLLKSDYTTVTIGQGAVSIVAVAGSQGCTTLEVADSAGAVYQVCVRYGVPINTFAK